MSSTKTQTEGGHHPLRHAADALSSLVRAPGDIRDLTRQNPHLTERLADEVPDRWFTEHTLGRPLRT